MTVEHMTRTQVDGPTLPEQRSPWLREERGAGLPEQRGPAEDRPTGTDGDRVPASTERETLLGGARRPGPGEPADEAPLAEVVQLRTPAAPTRNRRRWRRGQRDAGMATAEYAVVLLAAVGFAGLLIVILTSAEVREALTGLVRGALSV